MTRSGCRRRDPFRVFFRAAVARPAARALALLAALAWCALLAAPGARAAGAPAPLTGVEGVASLGGKLTPGVVVFAFADAGPGPDARPVASSAPTDAEGRYRLALPPGQYHLVARSGARGWGRAAAGELFCYHLGSPVAVEAGRAARVAFNLARVPAEPPAAAGGPGVRGSIRFDGKPLARAYLYVYRDPANAFRGMGDSSVPADERGEFRLRLAPGRYWLLARKRRLGGMYGPPGKDDYVGYYPGNPVEIAGDRLVTVTLETTTRLDQLDEAFVNRPAGAPGQGSFGGRVVDAAGAPVAGLYVLFYRPGQELSGAPARVAGPTGADGRFTAPGDGARYRIVARANLGGPAEEGEWYGAWRGARGEAETAAASGADVKITVARQRPR
jgi:hypothetical protein